MVQNLFAAFDKGIETIWVELSTAVSAGHDICQRGIAPNFRNGKVTDQVAILLPIEIQPDKLGDNRYGKDKQPYAHQDGAQIHYPISLYFLTHL